MPNELVPLRAGGKGIDLDFLKKLYTYESHILDKYDKFDGVACIKLGIVQYVKLSIRSRTFSKRVFDTYYLYANSGQYRDSSSNLNALERKAESVIKTTGEGVFISGVMKNGNSVTVKKFEVMKTMTRRKPKNMTGCVPMYAYWFCGWVSS